MRKYVLLIIGVIALCMLLMQGTAPATVNLYTTIYTYTGLSTDTKPETGVPTGSTFYETDTGVTYIWDLSNWSVYYDETPDLSLAFPIQMLGIPGSILADTVSVPTDSASVKAVADSSLNSEHASYHNIFGNGSDSQDRAVFTMPFVPYRTTFDSLVTWLRSNQTDADSAKHHIAIFSKGADGVTSILDTTITVAAADTWERFSFPISGLTAAAHTYVSETFVGRDHWMDVAPAYLK